MRVALVEVPLYANTLPLASGYLQTYAQSDPALAAAYHFTIVSRPVVEREEELVQELLELDCDVYAFSCYLWNMRRMSAVLAALLAARPRARFILGGPQVMDHLTDYVGPGDERVTVANAEGESVFAGYLAELLRDVPDLRRVPGISFWADGEPVDTGKPDRLRELDDIPSPFAAGVFDGRDYTFAVVETNRGCPFSCTYCYWGAATNDKVHRWDTDRVKADLLWLSEHGVESLFIADANWGALPRDVELSRFLVECKERNGYPLMINMQAAKNRPDRVTEITEILMAGGMLTSQPVSLQTVSPTALAMVDRANIKESTYVELQRSLDEKQISSYTELIWPLPGETLDSFREGTGRLCGQGANAIVTYPQLLLRNTPMERQRETLGIETVRVSDDVSEADVVVATKWVDRAAYEQGVWFTYAVITLHNARAAFHTAAYLDAVGACDHAGFLTAAARWFQEHTDNPLCRFFADSVASLGNYDLNNVGTALHMVLHSHRAEVDRLLLEFLRASPWWEEYPLVRTLFEIDLLSRPYVYREPVVLPSVPLERIRAERTGRFVITAELPTAVLSSLREARGPSGAVGAAVAGGPGAAGERVAVTLDHRGRRKMPYPRHRSVEHNAAYCQAMMNRLQDILPAWDTARPATAAAAG